MLEVSAHSEATQLATHLQVGGRLAQSQLADGPFEPPILTPTIIRHRLSAQPNTFGCKHIGSIYCNQAFVAAGPQLLCRSPMNNPAMALFEALVADVNPEPLPITVRLGPRTAVERTQRHSCPPSRATSSLTCDLCEPYARQSRVVLFPPILSMPAHLLHGRRASRLNFPTCVGRTIFAGRANSENHLSPPMEQR
jgi:hypothetical protein